MPAGDAGEEFNDAMIQQIEQVLNRMAMRGGRGVPRPHFDIADKVRAAVEKLRGWISADTPEGKKHAWAIDEEEADQLRSLIEDEGLKYTELRDESTDYLYRFEIDADDLEKCSPAFKRYFNDHTLSAMQSRLGLEAACTQVGAESQGDLWPDDLTPGDPSNRTFGFKTVEWDKDGQLLQSSLENAGIPFKATPIKEGVVKFEVPAEAAPFVLELSDTMAQNIKGVDAARFEFPDGFGAPPVREFAKPIQLDPDTAQNIMNVLDQENITYTASQLGPDGPIEIVAEYIEPAKAQQMASRFKKGEYGVLTPEQAEAFQKSYDTRNVGNRVAADKEARQASQNTAKKGAAQKRRNGTLRKDQKRMERSARAQNRGAAKTPKRTQVKGKGAM